MSYLSNKRILVTGVCGTIGQALLERLVSDPAIKPAEIGGIDNNESELFFLEQVYSGDKRVRLSLGDVRDYRSIEAQTREYDVVFHAAALKHVSLCETSPTDAVQSNILGVQNLIEAAKYNDVEKVIFTSSDKAVNPTNVMGTTKLMGERLITAANNTQRGRGPIFASTRFGNVLGSNGSVIPLFRKQIQAGGPVTLTDSRMTRFVMSIGEASDLVLNSSSLARGGEVFVTKMPILRIADLATVMIDRLAPEFGYEPEKIAIEQIGSRPGEKLFEELMSSEETRRTIELEDYFSVIPAFPGFYRDIDYSYPDIKAQSIEEAYVSSEADAMNREEIESFLDKHGLLSPADDQEAAPPKTYWPGEK